MIKVRPFTNNDFPQWLPLWNANNQGHEDALVTTETWGRIVDPNAQVHGLGAFDGDTLKGLVHYITHPTTGHVKPVCYMQDLFVAPAHRKKGIARKLVKALEAKGRQEKWARLYWLAEGKNEAAQNLYKTLGTQLDFTLHVIALP